MEIDRRVENAYRRAKRLYVPVATTAAMVIVGIGYAAFLGVQTVYLKNSQGAHYQQCENLISENADLFFKGGTITGYENTHAWRKGWFNVFELSFTGAKERDGYSSLCVASRNQVRFLSPHEAESWKQQ